MSSEEQTPRVHAEYLSHFVGRRVRLVGKVVEQSGGVVRLDSKGNVTVQLPTSKTAPEPGRWMEVIAEVQPGLTLRAFTLTDFGPDLDPELVFSAVDNCHKYKNLFVK